MMEQPSEDDNPRIVDEHVSRWISTFLRDADVNQERTRYLSNYRNVLNDLPNAKAEDWDLAAAVVVQIISSNIYGNTIDIAKFQEASLDDIERLMYETERFQPEVPCEIHNMRRIYEAQPRFGTFVYSRIAMAMVSVDEHPENLIRIYEDVLEKVRPFRRIDVSVWNRSLVRDPLQNLYEQVERYEDALNLSFFSTPGTVWVRGGSRNDEDNARRFLGWMTQLSESGGIAEVKRFLDLIYALIKDLDGTDHEGREKLMDCPKDTRQYWAWFYGYALGSLLVEKPGLRQSLLYELDAGKWSEGWHAGGVVFDIPSDSWDDYRQWALKFYHDADIEHRVGPSTNDHTKKTSSGARQPPHLSAQSDLYWSMRVGFADAHLESGEEKPVSPLEIAKILNQVKATTSSSARHILRIESEMDRHWQDINKGLPPTEEHRREMLRHVLGRVYNVLPERTIQHLAKALDRWHSKDPDGQRIAIGQAVESLFHELVIPEVQRVGEGGITIRIQQRGGTTNDSRLDGKRTFQMSELAQILGAMRHSKDNTPFELALNKAFPEIDVQALSRLSEDLREMSNLRGRASHYSRDYPEWKVEMARKFWNIVVGGEESTGFIEKLCTALGLVEREPGQSGKGGGTVR